MDNLNSITVSQLLVSDAIYCCQFDGKGHAIKADKQADSTATVNHPYWLHLDATKQSTIDWITSTPLLPKLAKKSLIDNDQNHKEIRFDTGILVALKGINPMSDTAADAMSTFRFYIMENLIISTGHQPINAITGLIKNLEKGIGPVDVANWLIQLAELLTDRANQSFDLIHNKIITLEDNILNQHLFSNKEIGRVRKQLFVLRRLLVPKRDIFVKIATERVSWIDDNDRQHLHDISTRLSHCVSDIDTSILRIASLMEQINALLTESMNKRIYLMTLFTLIFMPITFLTSLLGVNLTGIPFNDKTWAFGFFSGLLIVISIGFIVWLKSKKWL